MFEITKIEGIDRRSIKTKTLGVAAVLGLALTVGATDVVAQSAAPQVDAQVERARLLTQHGEQLASLALEFEEAATYLREAAVLWGDRPQAVENLLRAGHLAYHGGRSLKAVSALKSAGELALELGDQETAARAFFQAAWVADRAGEIPTALGLLERSRELNATSVASLDR